jgi:hypothetical protein
MVGEPIKIDGYFGGELYVDDVAELVALAGFDFRDIFTFVDDPFGQEKPGREWLIFTGGSHGDAHGSAADANLEGFFLGQLIGVDVDNAIFPADHALDLGDAHC